jgi:type IV pilus assembly protein PilE
MTKTPSALPRTRGFTLIELMVAVAIVAILAAIALPAYNDYILRSRIPDGTNALAALRARMEQYYQDNRSYLGGPCAAASVSGKGYFSLQCGTLSKTAYTITATGTGPATGFVFTLDNTGTEGTTGLPAAWGSVPAAGYACWVTRRGQTC